MTRRRVRSVLVGMGETAGYCTQLVDGLRLLGLRSEFLNLADDRLAYGAGHRPGVTVSFVRWLSRLRNRQHRFRFMWVALYRAAMAVVFLAAIVRYDAFIFRAGDSFFALRDLGLLRRLGKPVVVVFFGSDSRPSYMNGAEVARGVIGHAAAEKTAAKRRVVERTERHASEIVCHVLSAQLHTRRTVAFLEMGIPRRVFPEEAGPVRSQEPVVALHAPSQPEGKGTRAVVEAVKQLREQGLDLELTLLTGRPNGEVLDAIGTSDFVIDQVHSDTPMAAFAAEAAARGRPAIVAGYGWEELRPRATAASMPPTLACAPTDLASAIQSLAANADYRVTLGQRARAFIEANWSPELVAARYIRLLEGTAPDSWRFDPAHVVYPYGAGIDANALQTVLRGVMDADGREGFHVADKPLLEARLVEIAGMPPLDS